jgi:hypothetical protein
MRRGIGQPVTRKKDPRFSDRAGPAMSRTSICHARHTRSSSLVAEPRAKKERVDRMPLWFELLRDGSNRRRRVPNALSLPPFGFAMQQL